MTSPGTILLASRAAPHHGAGGMEIVAWDLARAFARRGLRSVYLTTRIPGLQPAFTDSGVDVITVQDASPARYSEAWWRGSRNLYLREFSDDVDALISVSAGGFALAGARTVGQRPRTILQAHGTSTTEIVSKWRTRRFRQIAASLKNVAWLPRDLRAYGRFDAIVAVGDRAYDALRRPPNHWFVPQDKLHLVRNGIDTDRFAATRRRRRETRRRLDLDDASPLVVTVSRLHRQKGLREALRGFARYAERVPHARWLVVGDGPDRGPLERQARDMGLSQRVRFVGSLDRLEVPSMLAAADLFLFTTLRVEGLPLNVLEALAAGLGVVISHHVNLGDALRSSLVAVDPFDTEEIATAIDVAWRQSSEASRLPVSYGLDACVDRYVALSGIHADAWAGRRPVPDATETVEGTEK